MAEGSSEGSRPRPRRRGPALVLAAALALLAVAAGGPAGAAAPPTISSLSQNAGPNTGGITITIIGTGFQNGARVQFGQVNVAANVSSSTSLSVLVPSVAPNYGPLDVLVENPDLGTSAQKVVFNAYEPIPGGSLISAAQAANHDLVNDGQTDVFGRGTDLGLWHTFKTNNTPNWRSWQSLGGTLSSDASAVSWGAQNRIDVFVRGVDNGLWHRWWDGAAWRGWESLGGALASGPAVASWGPGRLDVFAEGVDGQLWHKLYNGAWSGWEGLGGQIISDPGAVSWDANRLDVFARGTDNGFWHRWFEGGGWKGWEPLGGILTSSPGAASTAPGRLDVYAYGLGANLYHRQYDGSWRSWKAEGTYWAGNWAYSPGVTSQGFLFGVDLFAVGSDQRVWHTVTSSTVGPGARTRPSGGPRP
jgi:hypothetical protein